MPTLRAKAEKRTEELWMEVAAAAREGRRALRRGDAQAVDAKFQHIESQANQCNAARNQGRETYLTCATCPVYDAHFKANQSAYRSAGRVAKVAKKPGQVTFEEVS